MKRDVEKWKMSSFTGLQFQKPVRWKQAESGNEAFWPKAGEKHTEQIRPQTVENILLWLFFSVLNGTCWRLNNNTSDIQTDAKQQLLHFTTTSFLLPVFFGELLFLFFFYTCSISPQWLQIITNRRRFASSRVVRAANVRDELLFQRGWSFLQRVKKKKVFIFCLVFLVCFNFSIFCLSWTGLHICCASLLESG